MSYIFFIFSELTSSNYNVQLVSLLEPVPHLVTCLVNDMNQTVCDLNEL